MESENIEIVETLESEIKRFTEDLSYWGKFLAEKILSDNVISDSDIDTAYSYLLEDLILSPITTKPEIAINYDASNSGNYKLDLLFTKLENVEGVNALTENQVIEFSPNVTIIYGANGSGKSGYVRLMKKVFYSKAPEEIIKNIYLESGHKDVSAKFTFHSAGSNNELKYPDNAADAVFQQFSIFDGKSVLRHLDQRNEFEFRPAGLSFFADFTEAIKRVEIKLNTEIASKQSANDYADLFEGESEIKIAVQNLSAQTKITDLKKYLPYSDADKAEKKEIEKKYDDLLLASKGKEKEIKTLESIKQLLNSSKQQIEGLNQYFTTEYLSQIQTAITDCVSKEATAKADGIENFKSEKIKCIGTAEWKNFIVAAEQFAKKQKAENVVYPENKDNCLLCQQTLSDDAQKLITNYWAFIKSVAEQNVKQAITQLDKVKTCFEKLNFDLFLAENSLTVWLTEKQPQVLSSLQQTLSNQKTLAANIIADITTKTVNNRAEIKISVTEHDTIILAIDASIKLLNADEQSIELDKLLNAKIKLTHKEKLELHIDKIETFVSNQQWIYKTYDINWGTLKQTITNSEKRLSSKYFNQKYIDTFNQECKVLQGEFGISIDPKSSGAKSNRQLLIKGNYPSVILSEGEQKVIAIADFLSEMQLSEVNRGIIFDDPVNSLDHKRKEVIAKRLIEESTKKQVIAFTHDVVFAKYLEKFGLATYGKDVDKLKFHSIISNGITSIGNVELNHSPVRDSIYGNSNIPNKFLSQAIKETDKDFSLNLIRSGFGALRSCYEAITVTKVLGSTVQRFDSMIRVSNIKKIKYSFPLYERITERHSFLHDLIEGHLPAEEMNLSFTCEKLGSEIKEFE